MPKHARTGREIEFRKFSAARLRNIYVQLDAWHTEWVMGEMPFDALSQGEYPFHRSLEDLAAEVDRAVELLEAPFAEEYEPRHRVEGNWFGDRFVLDQRSARLRARSVARKHFRRMVTAFAGGYHPDTDDYIRYPEGYDAERVKWIEAEAESAGIDLYREALAVFRDALDH